MEESISQALAIVRAQAGYRAMSVEEIVGLTRVLAATIYKIQTHVTPPPPPQKGMKARGEQHITCLECAKQFKLITPRHLKSHNLTPEEYRRKWGYPERFPLICKSLQRARSQKIKDKKPWEMRRKTTT